jgi:hypothetical protein
VVDSEKERVPVGDVEDVRHRVGDAVCVADTEALRDAEPQVEGVADSEALRDAEPQVEGVADALAERVGVPHAVGVVSRASLVAGSGPAAATRSARAAPARAKSVCLRLTRQAKMHLTAGNKRIVG